MAVLRYSLITSLVLLAGMAVPAFAQLCAIDPINPLCCPSPCPIFDATRIPKLLADVESLKQALDVDAQIVQTASQIGQTVGDAKAVASAVQRLSTVTSTLSGEVTAIQAGLPTNPVQALASIKQSLFETAGGTPSITESSGRIAARAAAAQNEQLAALATSLMRSQSLADMSSRGAQLASATSDAQQLQGDVVVNSTSRLAVYQDIGALHQLVSAWVAQRSMQAAVSHPSGTGGAVGTASATTAGGAGAKPGDVLSQNAAGQIDQLISLHDDRVSAQVLLSAYPALQQTVTSASLAGKFAGDADVALRRSLSNLGLSDPALLSATETALRALDTTNWLDSAKTIVAQQAASKATTALLAGGKLSLANADDGAAMTQVQAAMVGWLDADKQNRYWAIQAAQAQQSIAALDATLGGLSDRAGADLAGAAGSAQEKALVTKLLSDPATGWWKSLLSRAGNDSSAQSLLSYPVAR